MLLAYHFQRLMAHMSLPLPVAITLPKMLTVLRQMPALSPLQSVMGV